MGELSSFYGGRRGFSFILTKTFDGYDIPQPDTDPTVTKYTYGKAYYAIDSNRKFIITDRDHGGNVPVDEANDKYLIKRDGTNYSSQNWLDHDNDGSLIDDSVYHFPIVIAQGLKQCFEKGAASLNEVAFSDYVIIDSVVNMCNWDDPDNGKIYQRGGDPNNMYKEKYICQITGPKGDSIINELDHYENVEEEEPYFNIIYSEAAGDLIPGKEIDEGTTVYNDTIHFAYRYVYNKLGNIEKCLIGFKLPTLVDDFSAKHSSAYDEHGNIIDPDTELISRDTNFYHNNKWDHPFYQKWNIKIPKGIHGINSKDFELVPTKTKPAGFGSTSFTGTQAYTDVVLTNPSVLLTDSYDTLRDANFPVKDNQGTVYPNAMAVMYNGDKLYVAKSDCYKNILRYKEINYDQHESGDITYYELDFFESGHRIIDQNGVELEQRSKLKFEGDRVEVTDDAINDITKVKVLAETPERLGIGYGICSTASATLAKEAALNGYNLTTNGVVAIKFEYAVPANSKLNINNKGAKSIYYKGVAIVDKIIKAGNTATFYYDGTNYQLVAVDNPSGGHVILDTEEQELQQREKLWFKDALVSDNSNKEVTSIEVMHSPMSLADYNEAENLPDGIYPIEDDDSNNTGHKIKDNENNILPQRTYLKFGENFNVSDDQSTIPSADTTIIEYDLDNAKIPFIQAFTRENISGTNSIATNFSRIQKYFADLKPHAFTQLDLNSLGIGGPIGGGEYLYVKGVSNYNWNSEDGILRLTKTTGYGESSSDLIPIPIGDNYVAKTGDTMSGNLTPATNKGAGLGASNKLWYYNYLYRIRGCVTIDSSTDGSKQIGIPSKSGTMALTSDIPTYNFSGTNFYSGNSSTAEHNANNAVKNGNYYYTSNGPSTSLGATTDDGSLYVQSYSDSWVSQIAQDYRNGRLFVRGKNNGTWQEWLRIAMYSEIPTDYAYRMRLSMEGTNRLRYELFSKSGGWLTTDTVQLNTSSRKYKENIEALTEDEAKKILDIETVTFDYKKDHENYTSRKGYKNVGCIAEDVDKIIPEVVTEDNGEIYGINYTEMIPYLIKMIQIQQKEIDELKEKIITS